ncbi:MAG: dihydroneopterin triphosphate diphosphatase [Gammaproteobacteria bacterium]|nr:dihydroneopterin triphosphate diphosphatase [Gammaproteobacteria bacterium]MDH4254933.1 dihydroneopterin triphosphate diphosphatase [Gammaproteobacteria bacterium]MDH5308604.1 dihydroneopterin triphosphate diphosphatase [Gammaproteobacteria bacterium]
MGEFRRPESVLVLIYTEQADVLLLERVQPFPFWQSVTGTLGPGELPAATAEREVFEETGLKVAGQMVDTGVSRVFEIDPRWRHRYAPGVVHNTEYEFRCRLPGVQAVSIDAREHSAYRWLDVDRAIEAVWSWTNREALERLREEL